MYGDFKSTATLCRKDRRLHLVGPGGRPARRDPLVDRRHRRLRLLPGHRDADSEPWCDARRRPATRSICSMPIPGCRSEIRRDVVSDDHQRLRLRLRAASSSATCRNGRKNALQADPTAAGDSGSVAVIEGVCRRHRRQILALQLHVGRRAFHANLMADTGAPIYASSALLFVGTTDVYMFFATGSDLLASSTPGGTGTFRLYGLKDNYPAAGADHEVRARSRHGVRTPAVWPPASGRRHRHRSPATSCSTRRRPKPRPRRAPTSARTCTR